MRFRPPRRGADNPGARLSQRQAEQLRARHHSGESLRHLAREAGVCQATVWKAVNRYSYRDDPNAG